MTDTLPGFKAYDVRGRVPEELDEPLAERIGQALFNLVGGAAGDRVVVGRDVRESSPGLVDAFAAGAKRAGATVLDLGLCGTEEVYFATAQTDAAAGVMVTASHNPAEYNGLKFVSRGARPLSGESGLPELERMVRTGDLGPARAGGSREAADLRGPYVEHLLGYVDAPNLAPLTVVVDPGNGCAGPVIDRLAPSLPGTLVRVRHEPDGTFPNGVPNPMHAENRKPTIEAIAGHGADLGVAWDGDFDRCFFYDAGGRFIEGYYLVGLLAEAALRREPGQPIVHDPRLVWNTEEIVAASGGRAVQSRCGHAFIKDVMRKENALYGGEMSAHHYFRAFNYCDSGMIPFLLVWSQLTAEARPLAALVEARMARFPVSGEINRRIDDPDAALAAVEARYGPAAERVDRTDGLGLFFADWRFNLRKSNTEPVIRLNVETRGDAALLAEKTEALLGMLV